MSLIAEVLAILQRARSPRATLSRAGVQPDLPFEGMPSPQWPRPPVEAPTPPMGIASPDPLPRQLELLIERPPLRGPALVNEEFPLLGEPELVPEEIGLPRVPGARLPSYFANLERIAKGGTVGDTKARPEVVEQFQPGPEIVPGAPLPGEGLTPRAILPRSPREGGFVPGEPDLGVPQHPAFMLDRPIMSQLREAEQLPRKTDQRLERVLGYIQKLFGQSGLPEEELTDISDTLGRFGSRVRTPLEGASEVESGLGIKSAMEVLRDVRNRLNPLGSRVAMGDEDYARAAAAPREQRAREAADLLRIASATRSGGDISDFTGEARRGGMLTGNMYGQRREKAGQIRRIVSARVREGKQAPSDRRLSQYQLAPVRQPLQWENIPDPESIRGLRPGVDEDPFKAVQEGQVRSVIRSAKEVQGLRAGDTVELRSGDGRKVLAEVVDVKQASPSEADAIGLRMGVAPADLRGPLAQMWERDGPQAEVIFRPKAQAKPGLESPDVYGPALQKGKEAVKDAYSGVDTATERVELGLSKAQIDDLAKKGYTAFKNEVSFARSRTTGAPFWVVNDAGDKAIEIFPAKEGKPAKYGQIRSIKEVNTPKYTRAKTLSQLRSQPRDSRTLGRAGDVDARGPAPEPMQGPRPLGGSTKGEVIARQEALERGPVVGGAEARSVSARPDDRRDLESRPTSVGKEVTDPREAMSILRGKRAEGEAAPFMVTEHWQEKYTGRTYFNAKESDATLSINANPGSSGARQTAQAAGKQKFVDAALDAVVSGRDQDVIKVVAKLNRAIDSTAKTRKGIVLNIAGNSLSTLRKAGVQISQAELNEKVAQFLERLRSHHGRGFDITGVITGGQTGLDEAGALAARKLGIPTVVVMPKNYQIREPSTGVDIWTNRDLMKRRFAGEDISQTLAQMGQTARQRLAEWKKNNPGR